MVDELKSCDDLGKQHGSELSLMLAGRKALSVFTYSEGADRETVFEGQEFEKYVKSGVISHHKFSVDSDQGKAVYELFCMKGEEWRLKSYELLMELLYTRSWSPEVDWLEARIFGLSAQESDLIVRCNNKKIKSRASL